MQLTNHPHIYQETNVTYRATLQQLAACSETRSFCRPFSAALSLDNQCAQEWHTAKHTIWNLQCLFP